MIAIHHGCSLEGMRTWPNASAQLCITDPPYGDTALAWDSQVDGWIQEVARILTPNASIWVFGSMRFLAPLFADMAAMGFKYSQDIVWRKQNGTGFHNDRFRRVHEHAVLFYRGNWADVHHETQYTMDAVAKTVRRKSRAPHWNDVGGGAIHQRGRWTTHDGQRVGCEKRTRQCYPSHSKACRINPPDGPLFLPTWRRGPGSVLRLCIGGYCLPAGRARLHRLGKGSEALCRCNCAHLRIRKSGTTGTFPART